MTSLLQILHWFNPLVWYAFYKIRTDREFSCDAFVLSRTGKEASHEYGQAIMGLLRRFSRSRPLPALAGILENRSQLKRRISMIAQFKKKSYQRSPLAVFLILLVSVVSLSFTIGVKTQTTSLSKNEPSISLRRIDTGPMSDFSGPPSLDGRYICDIERPHLVVLDLVTGEKRQLTEVSAWGMWRPVISPDSEYVAYLLGSQKNELQLIKMDGTGHRVLFRFEKGDNFWKHTWTPDGKQILGIFKRGKADRQLVSFSVTDGSQQVIYTFAKEKHSVDDNLTISPDGRFIASERNQKKGSELRDIYLPALENGQTEPVVQHSANDRILGWTHDQSSLLFASDRKKGFSGTYSISDTWDAYLLPLADGKRQGPPELINRNIPTKIRPKGFTRDGAFYYAVEFSTMEAAVAEVDMQTGHLLSKSHAVGQTGLDVAPAWSPDGRSLAYCIRRPEESQTIRIHNMETGEEREIDTELPHFYSLQWSPDGKSFLASKFVNAKEQAIYMVNVSSGERELLVKGDSNMLDVARFSRDGRFLFYVLQNPKTMGASLMVRDMESDQEKELFSVSGGPDVLKFLTFAFSSDGQKLALATFKMRQKDGWTERAILTMPVQGGESKELVKTVPKGAQYPAVAWTPDGKYLLYTDTLPEGGNAVFIIPSTGGEARELCRPQTMTYGVLYSVLDIHPDGKRLAFDCFEYRHEIWAMANFLPTAAVSKNR